MSIGTQNLSRSSIKGTNCTINAHKSFLLFLFILTTISLIVSAAYYFGPRYFEKEVFLKSESQNKSIHEHFQWLPESIQPLHYRLYFHPNLDYEKNHSYSFTGRVSITIRCIKNTKFLVLNARNLNINQTEIMRFQDVNLNNSELFLSNSSNTNNVSIGVNKIANVQMKSNRDFREDSEYVIELEDDFVPGSEYVLRLFFNGNYSLHFNGIFRRFYKDSFGQNRSFISSNFYPTHAREAFPCFDLPQFKSTFQLSIARNKSMISFSNTIIQQSEIKGELVWDHYKKTSAISTHKLTFSVGELHSLSTPSIIDGPLIKIWAPKYLVSKARYALDTAVKLVAFLEQYLDDKYESNVNMLSLIKFPENYYSSSLLLDTNESNSIEAKYEIFKAVSRLLVYKWFQNGINDWNESWIVDSVALYITEIAQKNIVPEWNSYSVTPLKRCPSENIMNENNINISETKLNFFFNPNIHVKGTYLLRTLNHILGEKIFRKSLKEFKSNSKESLWECFNKIGLLPNYTITNFVNGWLKDSGYPIISITRNISTGIVHVQQKLFSGNTSKTEWKLNLSYITAKNNSIQKIWMEKSEIDILNIENDYNNWIMFNIDGTGYYRTNYEENNWKLLTEHLNDHPETISAIDIAVLIDDSFELAKLGLISYEIPFSFTKYLKNESRPLPWVAFLKSLKYLHFNLLETKHNDVFQKYVVALIEENLVKYFIVKENEPISVKRLRKTLLETACEVNHASCLIWAETEFDKWMESSNKSNGINYDYMEIALCSGIKARNQLAWNFMWNRTKETSIFSRNLNIFYSSLACTNDPILINRYLELIFDGFVSEEYVSLVWKSLSKGTAGLMFGLKFLMENSEIVFSKFNNSPVMRTIIEDFLPNFTTPSDLEVISSFLLKNNNNLENSLIQRIEARIALNIQWIEINAERIEEIISQFL